MHAFQKSAYGVEKREEEKRDHGLLAEAVWARAEKQNPYSSMERSQTIPVKLAPSDRRVSSMISSQGMPRRSAP